MRQLSLLRLPIAAAVPDDLTAFGRTAMRLADDLGHEARRLDAALGALVATESAAGAPDRSLASAVARHALAAGSLGASVARVAEAFRRADGGPRVGAARPVRVSEAALGEVLARRANAVRLIERGDPDAWALAVDGAVCRPGGTRGGGFITGPDGRRYPIVVPEDAERPDPRWRVVAVEDGIADLGAHLGVGMKLLLGAGLFGLAANNHGGGGRPAGPGAYADLVPPAPTPTHGTGRPGVARRARPVPPSSTDSYDPIRPGATRADDTVAAPLLVGVASLAAAGAAAARGLDALENQNVVATRVTYEADDRGRRRATVRIWQIYEHDDGSRTVGDSYAYLGPHGKPTLTPVATGATSIRP